MLRAFSRLLPPEFRERVFGPALSELEIDERLNPVGFASRLVSRAILLAECLRLGRFLWS